MDLNLIAPIGYTGYGVAGLNILRGLSKNNNVTLFMSGQPYVDTQEDADTVKAAADNFNGNARKNPCLKIWHQYDLATHCGDPYFAFPFFELNRFNPVEQYHIKLPDAVIVASKWAKHIVEQYRKDNVYVVPLGVDPDIFAPRPPKKKHAFTIMNIGKWEKRKGHDIIPQVFEAAFSHKDNVELHMFPHNPFLRPEQVAEWEAGYKNSSMGHKTFIHPRVPTHAGLRDFMAMADLGFFPSRAEGWNLELLEMMALGKHVITTNYSAHTEFCTPENSTLINIDKDELAQDGKWFFGQGDWAALENAQLDAMVEALRAAYKKWQSEGDAFINHAGVETGRALTWDATCGKIEKVMDSSSEVKVVNPNDFEYKLRSESRY